MTVLGLDLSLTSTGVSTGAWSKAIRPKKLNSYPRLRYIRSAILDVVIEWSPDLVVVEGPSFGSVGNGQHERGGLWWMVTEYLDQVGLPLAIAPPASVKKYATGKGNAEKDAVLLAASRRFESFAGGNDEADATWLCAMGHDWLKSPLAAMPELNRSALEGVQWPQLAAAVAEM